MDEEVPLDSIHPRCVTSGTHLIVGGFGGLGVELCDWLLSNCAACITDHTRKIGRYNNARAGQPNRLVTGSQRLLLVQGLQSSALGGPVVRLLRWRQWQRQLLHVAEDRDCNLCD